MEYRNTGVLMGSDEVIVGMRKVLDVYFGWFSPGGGNG